MIKLLTLLVSIFPILSFAETSSDPMSPVIAASHELHKYPHLHYPNSSYMQLSSYFENGKVLIFCYGTLVNSASAWKTISKESFNSRKPVMGFGLVRIINVDGHIGGFLRDRNDPRPDDEYTSSRFKEGYALPNAIATNTYHSQINGLLIEVTEAEVKQLIDREVGYDLIPVIVMDWQDQPPHFCGKARIAYTFSASDQPRGGKIYTNTHVRPNIRVMQRLREAFYRLQDGTLINADRGWTPFREYFERTTFFADGSSIENQIYFRG